MEVRLRDRNSWIIGADVNISSREREEIGVERERERERERWRKNMNFQKGAKMCPTSRGKPPSQETWDMGGYWTWEEVD